MCLVAAACGKSGPPLPPLIKVPAAPANIVAERRGAAVDLQFIVPSANADGTRPANVERVDVYAITGPTTLTDDQILKHGTKVAGVAVKAPRDPNLTVEPDDPDTEVDPPEGEGVDQGSLTHAAEELTPEALVPYDPETDPSIRRKPKPKPKEKDDVPPRPLLGPAYTVPLRTYVGLGITTRGRKGVLSKRVAVPLVPPPPPPEKPTLEYDEKAVTLAWEPITVTGLVQELVGADDDVLPSTPIGVPVPKIAYAVYDVAPDASQPDVASGSGQTSGQSLGKFIRLTKVPIAKPTFADDRITWGAHRCYVVRTVETVGGMPIESEPSPPECATLTDTFAPAAPKNLQAVATEGTIHLIWDASPEKDLAGYLVLRGPVGSDELAPLTPAPIQDAKFDDTVPSGVEYVYVIKAIDKAGNISPASNRVTESAR